jgi:xanthine dehydrogenase accessory factor
MSEQAIATPKRAHWSERVEDIFALLVEGRASGLSCALVTIFAIEGGSPRGIGAHMAVLSDGRYSGYVSGGCVEAAVATEALHMIADNPNDRPHEQVIRFGSGSRYLDIKLPCGGAIDLHFYINPAEDVIAQAAQNFDERKPFSLQFSPLKIISDNAEKSGFYGNQFRRSYTPPTHLVLCGNGIEITTMAKTAIANGYCVSAITPNSELIDTLITMGVDAIQLKSLSSYAPITADKWTAIVFLFHDFDWEMKLIPIALETEAFYIGAMGSPKTQATRLSGLRALRIGELQIARVRGPIGMVPATRDAAALAISVLAEIGLSRLQLGRLQLGRLQLDQMG